jgi:hypothetical protein
LLLNWLCTAWLVEGHFRVHSFNGYDPKKILHGLQNQFNGVAAIISTTMLAHLTSTSHL